MIPAPKTYEDWLTLSAEDRKAIHFETWDVYARDGVAIAYTAAARLALTSDRKILNIEIGTYHGGEYVLHMIVAAEDYKHCPPMLEDEFEGFRVVWMPAEDFDPLDESGATLEGSWVSDDGYYEFDFTRIDSGLTVSGRIGAQTQNFVLSTRHSMGDLFFSLPTIPSDRFPHATLSDLWRPRGGG